MGAIHELFKKTAALKRYQMGVGVEDKQKVLTTISASVAGTLRRVSVQSQTYNNSNYGYELRWYCDEVVDIRTGDVLTIDGFDYDVKAVNFFEDEEDGSESHKRATVVKTNNNDSPENP